MMQNALFAMHDRYRDFHPMNAAATVPGPNPLDRVMPHRGAAAHLFHDLHP
jgi:hypothetical protein